MKQVEERKQHEAEQNRLRAEIKTRQTEVDLKNQQEVSKETI